MADKLNPGDDLAITGSITSEDGRSTLAMQGDGNLVLYRSGGKARWATNTNGQTVSEAIMQGDGNFVMYGPGGVIWATDTGGHAGASLTVQNDGNVVIYDPAGNALWASNTTIINRMVPGFLPSTSGFHFYNSFPSVPVLKINILGQQIGIGDASNGLCGGMVFAARDYFEARIPMPPDTAAPSSGPLFDYMVGRLFDSFNLTLPPPPPPVPFVFFTPTPPFGPGPLTYMWLMDPALPDHETVASQVGLAPRGRAWIMINEQWPKFKADIDSGHPSPVALIEIKTFDPSKMGLNHQVLAYGYSLDGPDLEIRLYDPNHPDDDTVTMSLDVANPNHTTPVNNSVVSTVWCFFRPDYHPRDPSVISGPQWQEIGHANGVVGMTATNNKIFCATNDEKLWARDPVLSNVNWQEIGHAHGVVGMAAINNKLFCATNDNKLWARDPVLSNVNWQEIGHAHGVVGMAAINNKLFCATNDNKLWARDPVLSNVNWQEIGHAHGVVGMAAINNKLFCATNDNKLWARDPVLSNVNWQEIGHANDVVGMAATNNKLFCATRDNKLWARDP